MTGQNNKAQFFENKPKLKFVRTISIACKSNSNPSFLMLTFYMSLSIQGYIWSYLLKYCKLIHIMDIFIICNFILFYVSFNFSLTIT